MSRVRVLVTDSSTGLGLLTARRLHDHGHDVVVHVRDRSRTGELDQHLPGVETLAGDLSTLEGARSVAEQANASSPFDAVIHNAAVNITTADRTADGLSLTLAVNVLAPYLLTALVPATRLVYLSSDLHLGGSGELSDLQWPGERWDGGPSYANSKLDVTALCFAVASRWPQVTANAVHPGWVATRMGGAGAPDDPEEGVATQVWLAGSDDADANRSGRFLRSKRELKPHAATRSAPFQDRVVALCAELTGVDLPTRG